MGDGAPPVSNERGPVVLSIVGPTASGKSALAHAAAQALGGTEVVSADAFQVYRGMDIGTAKPTPAERRAVPHHLIDIVDADQEFSVAQFQHHYRAVVDDLTDRQVPAILVGGTGLYQRIAVDDFDLPGQWPVFRAELEAEVVRLGPEVLHQRLVTLDPTAAARMEPTNSRRIVRALEVCLGSGRPFSSFGPGLGTYPSDGMIQIGLRWSKESLAERINKRVAAMIDGGFVDEVAGLVAGPGLSRTAGQAVGYGEMAEVVAGRLSIAEAAEQITLATVQLAARQLRWFRRDPRLRWIDIEVDPITEALGAVLEQMRSAHEW